MRGRTARARPILPLAIAVTLSLWGPPAGLRAQGEGAAAAADVDDEWTVDPDTAVLWQNVPGPWRSEPIADLGFDREGRLLVLTRQDLWRHEGEDFVRLPGFDGRTHGSRTATIVPGGDEVWTAHKDELCRWRDGAWACFALAPFQPGEIAFTAPDDGWAVCDWNFMRIFRWDGERWSPLVEPLVPRHSANHLSGMTHYDSGDVWLMGVSTDLVHHDGEGFEAWPPPPGVNQRNDVREVCPLPDGRIVAMSHQAWVGDGRGWTALEGTDGLRRCFVEGDAVWLTGSGGRLTRWDGEAFLETPSAGEVQEMVFGPGGQGWAAQGGRLLRRMQAEGAVYRERAHAAGLEFTGDGVEAVFLPVDEDEAPELLLFNSPLEVRLYHNDGRGRFFDATADRAAAVEAVREPKVAACDLDGDGDADLLVGKGGDRSVEQKLAYYRNHRGRFEDVTRRGGLAPDDLTHKRLMELDCVDLDLDGDLDVYATVQSQDDAFPEQSVAYENVGHGVLRQRRLPARGLGGGQHWTNRSEFVDLFGDPVPELVSVNVWNVGHTVLQRTEEGAWEDISASSGMGRHYGHGGPSLAGDLNGDGHHDLLVMEGNRRRLYRNDGERLWEVPLLGADGEPLLLGAGPGGPVADDVDGDGDLDLLLADARRGVRLLRNDGGLRFREISVSAGLSVGSTERATFADIEGDGDVDVLVLTDSGRNRLLTNAASGVGRTVRLRSVRRSVAGADVRLEDASGALLARRTVPQDGSAVTLPPRAGEGERLLVRLSDGTSVALDAPDEGRAVRPLESGPAWLAGWLAGTVARRVTWAHRAEAGWRIAGVAVVLALLLLVGRRKALLRFGRVPVPGALLLAYVGLEFVVAGAGEATRWGAAGGGVVVMAALAWLDLRATRWRRATWVAHFRIERELGAGGMGSVYLARDTVENRVVALKILRPEIARRPAARERFIREAELGARFSHPNLVRIFEHGECRVFTGDEARRTSYLSMEYIDGRSLRDWVEGHDGIRTGQACRLVVSLLDALQTLHDAGVVHRDIKPDNVMLTPRGDLKITDFGLARGGGHETLTRTGDVMGTMSYMPPEQAETGKVGEAADLYAAGVMAYELLAGRLPFVGADPMQTLYKIFTEEPPPLGELCPDLPGPLVEAVHRALEKDPVNRWPSASVFAAALLPYADQSVETRTLRSSRSSRSRVRADLRPPTTGPGGTVDAAARPPIPAVKLPAGGTGAVTRPAGGEDRVTRMMPPDGEPTDGDDDDER